MSKPDQNIIPEKIKKKSIIPGDSPLFDIPIIEPKEEKKRIIKQRTGGHLIDNLLKSNKPKPIQGDLFESVLQETKQKIIRSGANIEYINRRGEGIKLSKGEYKLLGCLSNILYTKSQTINKKSKDYFTGNSGHEIITYKTKKEDIYVISPSISFTLYEITKEYYGGSQIGGENVKIVADLLYELADNPNKKALIRYTRVVNISKDKTREYFIERYDSLIEISTAGYKEFLKDKQIDEKKELVVHLHPIFRDQIEEKYVEFPLDFTKRMIEAYGSPNISEITIKLIWELSRALSGKKLLQKDKTGNPVYKIGQINLYWKIAESYMNPKTGKQKRPQLINSYFKKSIETAKKIGLLIDFDNSRKGETGEQILFFTLNKNWA